MTMPSLTPDSLRRAAAPIRRTQAPWARAPITRPTRLQASRRADHTWAIGLALLVLATFLIRARYLGNPLIDVDEQFYLLVGDRMLHGALPYVDIWDRKPIGTFLLYAAIRLLGGGGIVEYQLVASAFVAATAVTIATIARRISSPRAALVAGLAYVPALAMNGGAGGQTPVFYNLPMALAALILIDLAMARRDPATIRRRGMRAMLLVGVAMQIKYTALFEGLYFGLALLALSWRAAPRRPGILADMLLWVAVALLPTLAALAYYAAIGALPAFFYANFVSIAERNPGALSERMEDLRHIIVRITPFLATIAAGEWLLRRDGAPWLRRRGGRDGHLFAIGWLAAALLGFAAFGTFYPHYALPLLVPLAVASAPCFTIVHRQIGRAMGTFVLAVLFIAYPLDAAKLERRHGDAADADALAGVIAAHMQGRCPYVFSGDPIDYYLADACLPSRWPFPAHLSLAHEAKALGVDPIVETKRIMDGRPPVVVDRTGTGADANPVVDHLVRSRLVHDYRLIYARPNRDEPNEVDQVWALRRDG